MASVSLAPALRAAMALDDPARASSALPSLVAAVQHACPTAICVNLLAITRPAGGAPRMGAQSTLGEDSGTATDDEKHPQMA